MRLVSGGLEVFVDISKFFFNLHSIYYSLNSKYRLCLLNLCVGFMVGPLQTESHGQ